MNILTVEKKVIDLVDIDPDEEFPDTQFTVVDLGSDAKNYEGSDIMFPKLLYVEDYSGPALECWIRSERVILPLAWNIFIGDEEVSDIELLPITSLNARDFSVIVTNPIDGFRHYYERVRVKALYTDYDWVLPKIKNGQALAIPISKDENDPLCIYITHSQSKIPTNISSTDFL